MTRAPQDPARPRGPTGNLPRAPLRLTLDGHSASRAGPSYWLRGRALALKKTPDQVSHA
jgi:hypothetical protein